MKSIDIYKGLIVDSSWRHDRAASAAKTALRRGYSNINVKSILIAVTSFMGLGNNHVLTR